MGGITRAARKELMTPTPTESIVSIAIMQPYDGHEQEFLQILTDLYGLMERKGYSSDTLMRDHQQPPQYFHIRYWNSAQARLEAREDPEVHRFWAQLSSTCHMRRVYEELEMVDWKSAG
jgi:heme-degrading monooxygenase HmoA